jgi:hypothetical protein
MKMIWKAVKFFMWKGLLYGAGLGALYGTVLVPLFGTISGLVLGGIMGLLSGIAVGFLIGWVTQEFFNPLTNKKRFRWTIFSVAGLSGCVGVAISELFLYGPSIASNFGTDSLVIFWVPALIAAAAAVHAGRRFADRHSAAHRPSDSTHPVHSETELMRGQS